MNQDVIVQFRRYIDNKLSPIRTIVYDVSESETIYKFRIFTIQIWKKNRTGIHLIIILAFAEVYSFNRVLQLNSM